MGDGNRVTEHLMAATRADNGEFLGHILLILAAGKKPNRLVTSSIQDRPYDRWCQCWIDQSRAASPQSPQVDIASVMHWPRRDGPARQRQKNLAPQPRRFPTRALHIFGIAVAIDMHALGRQLQHPVG